MLIFLIFTVYRHLDYAIKNYANISTLTVGAFGYQLNQKTDESNNLINIHENELPKIVTCFRRYSNVTLNPSLGKYYIDAAVIEKCITLDVDYPPGSAEWANFSFYEYVRKNVPEQDNFDSLLKIQLKLPLRTILLNTVISFNTPQCFDLDVSINFDNKAHSGEIIIYMANHNRQIDCHGKKY